MINKTLFHLLFAALLLSCNNEKSDRQQPTADTAAAPVQNEAHVNVSDLPSSVIFRNWEPGDPKNSQLILHAYKLWDSGSIGNVAPYFADTVRFDLPDGRRITATNKTIGAIMGRYRENYKETMNDPFSLISVHNKDLDQDWVIAWTWNTWRDADGTKDSMLYCDNWRFKDGKIDYLNSLENKPSKPLRKKLTKLGSK